MTNLQCGATTCAYNQSHLCCLDEILVDGTGANRSQETSCDSFADNNDSYTNTMDCPDAEPATSVNCSAHHCVYNASGICGADGIMIEGSSAHQKESTSCGSFLARD